MRFRPLHDRVVVKRIDAEEKTAGGIIIPDTAKEKPQQAACVAPIYSKVRPPTDAAYSFLSSALPLDLCYGVQHH